MLGGVVVGTGVDWRRVAGTIDHRGLSCGRRRLDSHARRDQLVDLGLPLALVAAVESIGHAMLQVIAQRLLLDLVEGCAHGADLGQHVDAVAFLLDHARHAAHLAFDSAKPRELGFLQSLIHP